MSEALRTAAEIHGRLEPWLFMQRGRAANIVTLRRIATGHSRAMWFVELDDRERYVVRVEQGGVFGSSSVDEVIFMRAAAELGLPVAPIRWIERRTSVLGHPFFVMDYVDHQATPREERGLPAGVAIDLVKRLDEVHRADWSSVLPAPPDLTQLTHVQIDRWTEVYRSSTVTVPLLEEAAAWLHRYARVPSRVGIVHGDPGPGNFLHDGTRLVAHTDWEFAHLGDPMEDWAYLVQMRGSRTMTPDAWRSLIRDTVGVDVTDFDLRYWGAFNLFKGACANLTCRVAFGGPNPLPNMAIIGTALHQTFLRRLADLVLG
jgi:aminoglycoside phosphotransferase (APT) family kinase protein